MSGERCKFLGLGSAVVEAAVHVGEHRVGARRLPLCVLGGDLEEELVG